MLKKFLYTAPETRCLDAKIEKNFCQTTIGNYGGNGNAGANDDYADDSEIDLN